MLTKADLGKILGGDFGLGSVLFERSHKGHFVLLGLEATVTHLGAGVDELELDLFKSLPLSVHQQGLKEKGPIYNSHLLENVIKKFFKMFRRKKQPWILLSCGSIGNSIVSSFKNVIVEKRFKY